MHAFDRSPTPVAVYTAAPLPITSTVVYVNDSLCALSGYEKDHYMGHAALLLAGARPDDACIAAILPARGHEGVLATVDKRRPDGSAYRVRVDVLALHDDTGHLTHYLATEQLLPG